MFSSQNALFESISIQKINLDAFALAKHLDFNTFCEYLLPYRTSIEPLQNWHDEYVQKFSWLKDSVTNKNSVDAARYLGYNVRLWFANTYNIETRREPLPRLGAIQLLRRKKGACEDITDLATFALRSQGVPAVNDMVTYWATASGSHFLNNTLSFTGESQHLDITSSNVLIKNLEREPAKVVRITYAKQANVLANKIPQQSIPKGFMRTPNYIDVTQEYWSVTDVTSTLFNNKPVDSIVYACVYNYAQWRPTWWGKAAKNKVVFTNMCKGAVFLPMYYSNGQLQPAGYPVAIGYQHTAVLQPDTLHKRRIFLPQQDKYLLYRPGHVYQLFYWSGNSWQLIASQTATATTTEMVFDKVPANALFLMYPDNTQYKERPFMITDDGKRLWW